MVACRFVERDQARRIVTGADVGTHHDLVQFLPTNAGPPHGDMDDEDLIAAAAARHCTSCGQHKRVMRVEIKP